MKQTEPQRGRYKKSIQIGFQAIFDPKMKKIDCII